VVLFAIVDMAVFLAAAQTADGQMILLMGKLISNRTILLELSQLALAEIKNPIALLVLHYQNGIRRF